MTRNWDLTPRQTDVLRTLAEGKSLEDAASALDISIHTLKHHLVTAAERLGTTGQGRSVTIIQAVKLGYITLEEGT